MRKPVLLIFANFAILLVVFALLTQSLFIVQRVAVTEELAGHVDVQRGGRGAFQPVTKKTYIKTNDVLRAGNDGMAEFKWLDGTRLKLTPNTQLTVKKVSYNTIRKSDSSEFKLTSGKVFIRIMKSLTPTSKFEVETPTAVAAVRGTIFSVAVENGKTQIAVYKGQVKVTSGDGKASREKTIEPGQVALSDKAGELKTDSSKVADAEFESQPSIVRPDLAAEVKPLKNPAMALLSGQTEAGDKVTINGQPAKVMGNGRFLQRMALKPGQNTFNIVTKDKHGATASLTKTIEGKAAAPDAQTALSPAQGG